MHLMLLLWACPMPPSELSPPTPTGEPPAPAPPPPKIVSVPPPPGVPGPQQAGPPPAVREGTVDLSRNVAVVVTGPRATIAGTLTGTCAGAIQIIVIDTARRDLHGPVAVVDPPAVGPYRLTVPVGTQARIGAFCDHDRDGIVDPSAPGDALGEQKQLGVVRGDVSGIDLAL